MLCYRVLSQMITCLDSFLMLQSQYKIQEVLLAAQAYNQINKDKYGLTLCIHAVY